MKARSNNSYVKRMSIRDIIELKDKLILDNNNQLTEEKKVEYLRHTLRNEPNLIIELIYIECIDKYLCVSCCDRLNSLIDFLNDKIKFVFSKYSDYDCTNKTFSQIDEELRNKILDIIEVDFNIKPLEFNYLKYEDIVKNLIEIEYNNYCKS